MRGVRTDLWAVTGVRVALYGASVILVNLDAASEALLFIQCY